MSHSMSSLDKDSKNRHAVTTGAHTAGDNISMDAEWDEQEEKRLVRKMDFRCMVGGRRQLLCLHFY